MYQSEYRSRLRPYIETKLPASLVRLPWILPAPDSWCSCEEEEEEEEEGLAPASCPVHGECDQCQATNSICDCGWWWDQHFCNTCG